VELLDRLLEEGEKGFAALRVGWRGGRSTCKLENYAEEERRRKAHSNIKDRKGAHSIKKNNWNFVGGESRESHRENKQTTY